MKSLIVSALAAMAISGSSHAAEPADLVLTNAKIYTADSARRIASALAVRDGKIIFIGDASTAKKHTGPKTKMLDLAGKLVLPGLIDAHIHPTEIIDLDVCDLKSEAMPLAKIADFVRACIEHYKIAPGQWLNVQQWNFSNGNQPDSNALNLRKALDLAAPDRPVQLLGNDGHHGAFNSAALKLAKNADGKVVGLSKATLAQDFASVAKLVGLDASGEPDGGVNEDARASMNSDSVLNPNLTAVLENPQRITERLNSVGITAIQDAAAAPAMLAVYDKLLTQPMSVRINLAQYYDPEDYRDAKGVVAYDKIVAAAKGVRTKYSGNALIKADTIKLFADGVLEGNALGNPPTPPEAPVLKPYLQPIFAKDDKGVVTVTGYVNLKSVACKTASTANVATFIKANGFHPAQCAETSGKLQHERNIIMDYTKAMHLAGFTLHIHAIGDLAVRTAIDSIEDARAADGNSKRPDTIAHAQLVSQDDIKRIGRDHLYLAMTYAWIYTDPEYDMSVIPFIQRVSGNGYKALHDPQSYYELHAYPARAMKAAGGILVAGSDAPVDTRDPRPFVNMERAVTRAIPGLPALNPAESISINDVIDAYTINGAHVLGRENEIGSLEVGKSADFIVLDQDITTIAAKNISKTKVLETWFAGRSVFNAIVQN